MVAPLAGVRVLELARILAGPWAGQLLADLGCDVIKIERPDAGDDTRSWGPPFVDSREGGTLGSAYFHACNRGKRSVAADFATEEGRAVVRRLAAESDVLIENFKVGALARFGLDYEDLRPLNRRLVYCSITGFGQTGPYAARSGYDFLIQGMGGFMDLTGEPDGPPMKAGVAIADIFTGLYAAIGILAALRHRDRTGEGQHLDLALLDVQVCVLANQALNFLVSGRSPKRMGNAHPNIVPYEVFPVADGHVIVAVGNDGQYRNLCSALGAPELGTDPDYRDNAARVRNRKALVPKLASLTIGFAKADLMARLEVLGVPAGPINSVEEAFGDPQVLHRRLRVDLPRPEASAGSVPGVRLPILFSASPAVFDRPPPLLGEHTEEVLSELANAAATSLSEAG